MSQQTPTEFWEARYGGVDRVWSGNVNSILASELDGVSPGTALDLGCGEGGDALWLAEQGWQVTAADISTTAIDRGRQRAEKVGLADRITWERHDLGETFPAGSFDLVSAFYLLSPVHLPRELILRRAAEAVAPGGLLLIAGHSSGPPWVQPPPQMNFPSPESTLASLDLADGAWAVERCELVEKPVTSPDGVAMVRLDNILRLRRLP